MTGQDRKAELVRRKITATAIAKMLGVSRPHVTRVIEGERRSPQVEAAVAVLIGKTVHEVFGGSTRQVAA